MSTPFDLEAARSLFQESQQNPEEKSPMYLDWAFYNWGREDIHAEQETFKVTVSLDLEDLHIYTVVESVDKIGDRLEVPQEAYPWAASTAKPLIDALLQLEGVTYPNP